VREDRALDHRKEVATPMGHALVEERPGLVEAHAPAEESRKGAEEAGVASTVLQGATDLADDHGQVVADAGGRADVFGDPSLGGTRTRSKRTGSGCPRPPTVG
jgi:hypothetical protein